MKPKDLSPLIPTLTKKNLMLRNCYIKTRSFQIKWIINQFLDGTEILAYRARELLERKHDEKDEEKVRKIEQELAWEDDMLEVLVDSYRELEKTYVLRGILTDWFFFEVLCIWKFLIKTMTVL